MTPFAVFIPAPPMKTAEFDYNLPPHLIAAEPAEPRDASRLLVLPRAGGTVAHRKFTDLPEFLRPGDLLVVNDSRVIPARLRGTTGGGHAVELLLLERRAAAPGTGGAWVCMGRPGRRLQPGTALRLGPGGGLTATVCEVLSDGTRLVAFDDADLLVRLASAGEMPLPPYILQRRRELESAGHAADPSRDPEAYQTVYARHPGSVAAPTAGLHFTPGLLGRLEDMGVRRAAVTLHVGAGTFKPVEAENPADHAMHAETFTIPPETAAALRDARSRGARIVAVGTTTVRSLESAAAASPDGLPQPGTAQTRLLILPGYSFRVADALITNFHLPRSTLLMLVSAFAEREAVLSAYAEAIREEYRFYSYGDAMLIA